MGRKSKEGPSNPTDQKAIWMAQAQIDEICKLRTTEDFKYVQEDNSNSLAKYIIKEIIIDYAKRNGVDINPVIIRAAKMKAKKND